MSLKLRYFSLDEANALLAEIKPLLEKALELKVQIEVKVDGWRRNHKKMKPSEQALMQAQVDFLTSQLESVLGNIAVVGCVPKDLDMGLIDFPTRIDGKEGYLCWKWGEEEIRYWHGLTEGYRGRKPLKQEKK